MTRAPANRTCTSIKRWSALGAAVAMGVGSLVVSSVKVVEGQAPTNGMIAFQTSRVDSDNIDARDNIYVMNADGTGQTRLTYAVGQHGAPSWSPDGTRIAFHSTRDDVAGNSAEIYVMNADGTNPTRLTDTDASNSWPEWSPDGTQVAFMSRRDGNWEIYITDADGTNQVRLTTNTAFDEYPAWSPDGNKIAFNSSRNGASEIYVMNADGTGQTRLTDNSAADISPAWSPDGNKIAFSSTRDGYAYDYEIYTMSVDGTGVTRLTDTFRSTDPAWSPDGTQIAFATFDFGFGFWQIYTMNADGTNPVNRTMAGGTNVGPDWGVVPTVVVDTTPPTVECAVPAPQFVMGQFEALVWATVTDEVGGSGPLASPVSQPADTGSVGSKTVDITGWDIAENSTTTACPYTVVYQADQEQFFSVPVDNDAVNTAKAGQVIPIRWRITTVDGTPITDLTTAMLTSAAMSCESGATLDAIEEYAAAAGASGLQNLGDGYYQYNWKTSKAWAGTCRTVRLDLGEGITHTAAFRFVK